MAVHLVVIVRLEKLHQKKVPQDASCVNRVNIQTTLSHALMFHQACTHPIVVMHLTKKVAAQSQHAHVGFRAHQKLRNQFNVCKDIIPILLAHQCV
jgi:hypothetical protein